MKERLEKDMKENKIIWNISEIIKKDNEVYTGISELLTTNTLRVLESRAS